MIIQLRNNLQQTPDSPDPLNNLAWVLATVATPCLEETHEAVQVAEKALAVTRGQNPAVLDTVGAAYAQAGQFEKAVEFARRGLKLAEEAGERELADALRQRIRLYEGGRPVRE